MKRLFFISVLLNVLLCVAFVMAFMQRTPSTHLENQTVSSPPQVAGAGDPGLCAAPVSALRWSDLESDDYPTYLANLRSIGCPAQTIHDIIVADINALYSQKIRDLHSQRLTSEQLGVALDLLKKEQAALVDSLFPVIGNVASHGQALPSANIASSAPRIRPPDPVSVPLALLDPDPSIVTDQEHRNAWQNMQDAFVSAVGGEYQNPNDPGYYEKWKKAQEDMDDSFHAMFGDDAFAIMMQKRQVTKTGDMVVTQ